MLAPNATSTHALIAAAAVVHSLVSLWWAVVFAVLLPRAHLVLWAVAGSALVALLDLRDIAPLAFAVAALPFWPQFADHLMWGALLGGRCNCFVIEGHRCCRCKCGGVVCFHP